MRRRLHSQIEIASALAMSGRIERQVAADADVDLPQRIAALRSGMALYGDSAQVLRNLLRNAAKSSGGRQATAAPSQDMRHLRSLLEALQALRALRKLRATCKAAPFDEEDATADKSLAAELKQVQAQVMAGNNSLHCISLRKGASLVDSTHLVAILPVLTSALKRRRELRKALKGKKRTESVALNQAHEYALCLRDQVGVSKTPAEEEAVMTFVNTLRAATTNKHLWDACDRLREDARCLGVKVVD